MMVGSVEAGFLGATGKRISRGPSRKMEHFIDEIKVRGSSLTSPLCPPSLPPWKRPLLPSTGPGRRPLPAVSAPPGRPVQRPASLAVCPAVIHRLWGPPGPHGTERGEVGVWVSVGHRARERERGNSGSGDVNLPRFCTSGWGPSSLGTGVG